MVKNESHLSDPRDHPRKLQISFQKLYKTSGLMVEQRSGKWYFTSRSDPQPPKMRIVAEPPELSRLKCAGHHHKGNTDTNALQTEQFLVCRVTSRYNHRFLDRTSIPRTNASPEILQPYIFYNTGIVVITQVQSNITGPNLVKQLYKP